MSSDAYLNEFDGPPSSLPTHLSRQRSEPALLSSSLPSPSRPPPHLYPNLSSTSLHLNPPPLPPKPIVPSTPYPLPHPHQVQSPCVYQKLFCHTDSSSDASPFSTCTTTSLSVFHTCTSQRLVTGPRYFSDYYLYIFYNTCHSVCKEVNHYTGGCRRGSIDRTRLYIHMTHT